MSEWPLWEPKSGDLVKFRCAEVGFKPPVRVTKATFERFKKVIVPSEWLLLVLGQLDFETKLAAAYADEQQADCDPTGPDTHQSYFWCLAGTQGVYVIPRTLLEPA